MTARYAIRFELADSTILAAHHHLARKADAIASARRAAKDIATSDIVRIWVDDTKTELGVTSFETRGWKNRRESLLKELCQ
ncbi:hypothetical protein [Shinella sp.]|uniref:hypothetical protein n=1 Tax=Shinella sp. TaxID=1870904 RepID=UPI0028AE0E13|nr:hypothetical protein [Shinella sp.]